MSIQQVYSLFLYIRSFGCLLNCKKLWLLFLIPVLWDFLSAGFPAAQKSEGIISLWRWIPQYFRFLPKIQIIMGVKCYNFSKKGKKNKKKRQPWFFYKNAVFNTERWQYSIPPLSVGNIVQDLQWCLKLQIAPSPRQPICFSYTYMPMI